MKVGFDVSDLATGRADGTTRFTFELAKRLPMVDQTLKWLYFSPHDVSKMIPGELANVDVKTSPWLKGWTQLRLPWELYRFNPDVLLMPIQQLPYVRPGRMRTVSVVHDLAFHIYPEQFTYKDWALQHTFTAYACREADEIIAVSQATADDVARYYGRTKNVHVVHHGLDHNQFRVPATDKEKNEAWEKLVAWQPNLKKPYVLYVGQIQPRKNLGRLIKTFKMLESRVDLAFAVAEDFSEHTFGTYQLVLAGSHGWLNKNIYEQAATSSVSDRILMPGRVPDELLTYLYWHAEVFVLPSLYEGFGMPIIEAMGAGCPVVTSNVSCMPEVAGDAAVLVNPTEIDDIRLGIIRAINNKDDLVKKGIARAKEFQWHKTAENIMKVLQSL